MATPAAPPAWLNGIVLLTPPIPTKEELHREAASLLDQMFGRISSSTIPVFRWPYAWAAAT
jgi:hypothetical protein